MSPFQILCIFCIVADILTDTKEEVRNVGLFGCWTF